MFRGKSYDEELSERLQDPKYARGFLLALMEGSDGMSLEEALHTTIERMGIKEFSKMSKIASPNVVRMLKGRVPPTLYMLDRFLKPFGLRTRVLAEKAA
jgi:DNA-binding phage protein